MNIDGFYDISEFYLAAKTLFWVLTAGVLLLPPRWGLLCLAVVMQVDVSASEFVGTASVGWENAIKALVLPALMLFWLSPRRSGSFVRAFPARLWIVFILYVGLAGFWSPHKVAAAKAVAYLLSYLLLFWSFYWGWARGLLGSTFARLAIWTSLMLGCIQSFVMGNPMSFEGRFTSFSGAQAFAPWLVSLLAVALFCQEGKRVGKVTLAVCIAGIVMTGSRLAFIGLASLFLVYSLKPALGGAEVTALRLVRSLSATAVVVLLLCGIVLYAAPTNRLNQLLLLGSSEYESLRDIGTAAARLMTYEAVISAVSGRGLGASVFGSGTATGGDLIAASDLSTIVGYEGDDFVDPNRALNSDVLRALYEWGVTGLLLGITLVLCLLLWAWRLAIHHGLASGFASLGVLPLILLGLSFDNVLADSSTPQGVGFVLILSWAFWQVQSVAGGEPNRVAGAPFLT
jgi:hypothetical protein